MMGGSGAHEFMVLNPHGEDTLVLCDACGYAANLQVASLAVEPPEAEGAASIEEVETPGTNTIASLADYLDVPTSRTAKAAFFVTGDGRLVTAVVRGDFEVNETKLINAVNAIGGLRPATADEIRTAGMEPGYGSPIGGHDTIVVVDALAARSSNLVAGANRPGFHLRNVNADRDVNADVVADIANVREGDPCPQCGAAVRLANGIEVGNIFKLGTDFTESLGARSWPRTAVDAIRSWARTESGWAGRSPASSRRITTRRASPGPSRWRRTESISWRSAPRGTRVSPRSRRRSTGASPMPASRCCSTTATSRRA